MTTSKPLALLTFQAFAFLTFAFLAIALTSRADGGTPKQFPEEPLSSLGSIGQLQVPAVRYEGGYARHYRERCSATLVKGSAPAADSWLILSAWHCFEDYRDLSQPIYFQRPGREKVEARLLSTGESMRADWALLELQTPQAMAAAISTASPRLGQTLLMAGYPRTVTASKAREDLPGEARTDPGIKHAKDDDIALPQMVMSHCQVQGVYDRDTTTDCVMRKGASGGAVFNARGELIGVISRGDGERESIFVPVARFLSALRAQL